MLEDLQNKFGLTYLFAAHDLSMVRYISTRIGVMYLGTLVEVAESNELYTNPMHPIYKNITLSDSCSRSPEGEKQYKNSAEG